MKKGSESSVIIFDGNCRLCNEAVRFLKGEKTPEGFRFLPSSDPESSATLSAYNIEPSMADKTVILIEREKVYIKSAAIIRALQQKGGMWKLALIFYLIPTFIRDWIYDRIAKTRKTT